MRPGSARPSNPRFSLPKGRASASNRDPTSRIRAAPSTRLGCRVLIATADLAVIIVRQPMRGGCPEIPAFHAATSSPDRLLASVKADSGRDGENWRLRSRGVGEFVPPGDPEIVGLQKPNTVGIRVRPRLRDRFAPRCFAPADPDDSDTAPVSL